MIEIDDHALNDAFNRLLQAGGKPGPMLQGIGAALENNLRLQFVTSTDPYGAPWAPLKSRQGRPLLNTGTHYRDRITFKVEGDTLTVGTNFEYAKTHQYGATIVPKEKPALKFMVNGHWVSVKKVTIPARPLFPLHGLPDAWREDIIDVMKGMVGAAWDGA